VGPFRNILVGVDLTHTSRLDVNNLGPVTEGVLRLARWLGRATGGRLTLFAALNERGQPWHLIDAEHHARLSRAVEESVSQVMRHLAERERDRGVEARALLAPGKGWVELLQQSVRDRHDLVLIGSRGDRGLRRALFGSTGFHLLRHCPSPVWVARPGPEIAPRRLLVATDLGPASEAALRLGVALLHLHRGARLHVLHVVDYPLNHLWAPVLHDAWEDAYERQVRAKAEDAILAQLARAGSNPKDDLVEVHLVEGAGVPDEAILECIQGRGIDLVILGTVARSGLSALFLGNVAERLLPEVNCSVLAVKPVDFHSTWQEQTADAAPA
jgi:universal stress protein E